MTTTGTSLDLTITALYETISGAAGVPRRHTPTGPMQPPEAVAQNFHFTIQLTIKSCRDWDSCSQSSSVGVRPRERVRKVAAMSSSDGPHALCGADERHPRQRIAWVAAR